MGSLPVSAMVKMTATASAAPPIAPAKVMTKSRILSSLLRRQGGGGADDVAGALPVGAALGQLAVRAGGEDQRLLHVAGIVPELGGGEIGHRLVLQGAVGLGGLV